MNIPNLGQTDSSGFGSSQGLDSNVDVEAGLNHVPSFCDFLGDVTTNAFP